VGIISLIKTKNLEKRYKQGTPAEVLALDGINMEVEEGEMLGILGVSGSGKSTLLHILGCIDNPTKGDYYLEGEDVNKKGDRELAKIRNEKIGFVLQEYGLILNKTAHENVSIPLLFGSTKFGNIKDKTFEILNKVGLSSVTNRKVKDLSGGQKQRVAIARALVNDPDLILADEPSGALDTDTAKKIMELLVELNEDGKTIITVTHDPVVASFCKRLLNLEDGKLSSMDKDDLNYHPNK